MNAEIFTALEDDAYCLMEAAVLLDQACKDMAGGNTASLEAALSNNLDLWIAINSVISQPENQFSSNLEENLSRLSRYVVATIRNQGNEISEGALATLININLQISEGLLEGNENSD